MKNILVVLTVVAAIALVGCSSGKQDTKKHTEQTAAADVVYYGCPMTEHSHVADKEPGKCEECGMDMVAVEKTNDGKEDFYGCPMAEHSHIRQDEPGNCPECGMTLRPLKFDM